MVAPHLDRIVYLNGDFMPARDAKLSIFDRGLLFADAVYEGFGFIDGRIIDFEMHLKRLNRSLGELAIPSPMNGPDIQAVLERLISDNGVSEGFLYFHITRGEADRDYVYASGLKPNVFAFMQPADPGNAEKKERGVKMISHPDLRWKRRDIKTSNLLGQVIAKQAAHDADGYEALMVDDEGFVTEGGATSFFIVTNGEIVARPVTNEILHGVTRQAMLKVAEAQGKAIVTRRFTFEEALAADEAFITGASTHIQPVVEIDGTKIGDGTVGPIVRELQTKYMELIKA